MASINGLQNNNLIVNTIDGLQTIYATSIYDNGVLVDTGAYVPYTGATAPVNLGGQELQTSYVPTVGSDVVNLTALSNSNTYVLGVAALNYVPYTGATGDTTLGTYKISSSATPSTANNLTNKTYVDGQTALLVPYSGGTSNVVLTGTNKFQQAYNALTSDTTTLVNRQTLDSAISGIGAGILNLNNTWGTGYTNNFNSALKTINAPFTNNNAGINAESITAISPSTYTLVSSFWRFVAPSATTGSVRFPDAFSYGTTANQKYILTLTGCSTNGTAPVLGTVYNATTSTTISDVSQTITSTAQTITWTFTVGTVPSIIYISFSAGATNYYVQWSTLSVTQANTEVVGALQLDSPIISNIVQATGKTANLAGGILVNQTDTGVSASTFTQTGMPSSAPTSTLSYSVPTYTLTAAGTFATWLGSATTYITGSKYYFSFGTMLGSQYLQLNVLQYNSAGSGYIAINDSTYGVPSTSSTISGSFTAGANASYTGSIVFYFTPTIASQNVKFNTFSMTRADTSITGIITATAVQTDTPATTIGLNASNQLIKYTNPVAPIFTGSVGATYIPYASSSNVLANSIMYQSSGSQINIGGTLSTSGTITTVGDVNCVIISPSGGYGRLDNRSLKPKSINAGTEQFFFASWNNDGGSPYADAIGMNGWTDSSGGLTNVLMVRKDYYGIRQYLGTFGSNTAFINSPANVAQYMDCCMKGVGDNTKTTFQPIGGTWNVPFNVGSGTDSGTAQIIATDGNVHIDSSTSHAIYLGYYRNPVAIYTWASSSIQNNTRYQYQFADVDGDAHAYFRNASAGANAYFNIIVANNVNNVNHFFNSSNRTADGGINCYTIRNDSGGGARFMSNNGGFSSYASNGSGGATYCNAVVNYTAVSTFNLGSWAASGYTLFCNTSQPSGSQPALGLGTSGSANYITSLSPSAFWMDLPISANQITIRYAGSLVAYTQAGVGWVNVSDEREKHDINDLKTTRSLERILKCKPKYYKRKYYDTDKEGNPTTPVPQATKDNICVGLLAQDVLQHTPHSISTWKNEDIKETEEDDTTRFGISYNDFVVHLIGAVQEHDKTITAQATTITTLQSQITNLQTQLSTLATSFQQYIAAVHPSS